MLIIRQKDRDTAAHDRKLFDKEEKFQCLFRRTPLNIVHHDDELVIFKDLTYQLL